MSYIFKIIFSLSSLTIGLPNVSAQDTICFKNQGLLSAKVLEVTKDQIAYKHATDSSDFIYKADKNRIAWIKYRNGMVDTIKAVQPTTAVVTVPDRNDIEIDYNRLIYQGKGLNEGKLKFLIDNCQVPETKAAMLKEYKTLKAYGRAQKIYTPIAMGCGFGIIPVSLTYGLYGPDYDTQTKLSIIGGGLIVGVIVGACSASLSNFFRHKRSEKRNNIALMYNGVN